MKRVSREPYFTLKNISIKSKEIINFIKHDTPLSKQIFDIQKAALLVLDMQQYFLDKSSHAFIPSSEAIIPGIKSAINYFNHNKRPVIFTRHLNNIENSKMLSLWWKQIITEDNPLSLISPDLIDENSYIIEKTQYDAFYETNLDLYLKGKNISQLIISGVMTNLCCETTARSAFIHGYQVFFPANLTAAYNEEFHKASLLNLSHGFAIIPTIEEIIPKIHEY